MIIRSCIGNRNRNLECTDCQRIKILVHTESLDHNRALKVGLLMENQSVEVCTEEDYKVEA